MIHAVSLQKAGLETATELLSQVVLHPNYTDEEIAQTHQAVVFELENLHMNPNKEFMMMEMIHAVSILLNSYICWEILNTVNFSFKWSIMYCTIVFYKNKVQESYVVAMYKPRFVYCIVFYISAITHAATTLPTTMIETSANYKSASQFNILLDTQIYDCNIQ